MHITTFIPGHPAPQGSKRYIGNGTMIESSKAVKPWRSDIREHLATQHSGPPLDGAITVEVEFVMPRPTATPKRSTPPAVKRPDVDKLIRAVLDAIGSAGIWQDDSQVTRLVASKRLAEISELPGCQLTITDQKDRAPLREVS